MHKFTAIVYTLLAVLPCSLSWAAQSSSLSYLSDAEKSYYGKIFDYTMDTVKPGDSYGWASYSGKGAIKVDKQFVSKSGTVCRNFSESFSVQGQSGASQGVGCKRKGEDGWCRLKTSNAMTCAMEDPSWMIGGTSVGLPSLGGGNVPNIGGVSGSAVVDTHVNTSADMPNGNGNHKPTTQGYADTVTGTAGQAAGEAMGGGISWFGKTFR